MRQEDTGWRQQKKPCLCEQTEAAKLLTSPYESPFLRSSHGTTTTFLAGLP